MSKDNPDLTAEQKNILFEEGTEPPGSSELNNEKEKVIICHCESINILIQSITVDLAGPLFFNLYLMFLKQK